MTDTIAILKNTEFFANLDDVSLEELSQQFESVYLDGGTVLIKEGEVGDCLYLVISGHLRTEKKMGTETIILGEPKRGELIGELALLTDEPRAATVIANRDCLLLKLSKHSFDDFIKKHPMQTMKIIKSTIVRILNSTKLTKSLSSIITLAPAGKKCNYFSEFVRLFADEITKHTSVLFLNKEKIIAHLKKSGIEPTNFHSKELIYWLNEQETRYHYIIYETESHCSEWTKLCLRQADKILLIAENKEDANLGEVEKEINASKITKSINLILIHEAHVILPSRTSNWLALRKVDYHHHIKKESIDTFKSLIRYLTGRCVGIVLAGGGAKGLSYIGVYKALIELGIPIDIIGGTSSGALVSCFFSFNYPPEQIIEMFKTDIVNKALDYTLPITSLTSGHIWKEGLEHSCGKTVCIEDLWKKFFCISTNITNHEINILQTGLLWKAIRASVSLPGIAPPISNEHGELLIDGGVLNNFPVDIMQSMVNGGNIIGALLNFSAKYKFEIPDGVLSGWDVFFQKINPFLKKKSLAPRIADIIVSSIILSSAQHTKHVLPYVNYVINLDLSNYKLLDFKAIDKLVAVGYEKTMSQLLNCDLVGSISH